MKKPDNLTLTALGIILVVLAGEAVALLSSPGEFGAEATFVPGGADYEVRSSVYTEYKIAAIDNGGSTPLEHLYIYLDDYFAPYCMSAADAEKHVGYLEMEMDQKGFRSHERLNADSLEQALIAAGPFAGKGILIPFGTLPHNVYSGGPSDPFGNWTANGGSVYWSGGVPGRYYTDAAGQIKKVADPTAAFPIAAGAKTEEAVADIETPKFCYYLSMASTNAEFALSPSNTGIRSLGWCTSDGYSSVSVVKQGTGAFFMFAGYPSDMTRFDISSVVSAGLTYESQIVDESHGMIRGSINGHLSFAGTNVSVYISLGGWFPVFSQRITA